MTTRGIAFVGISKCIIQRDYSQFTFCSNDVRNMTELRQSITVTGERVWISLDQFLERSYICYLLVLKKWLLSIQVGGGDLRQVGLDQVGNFRWRLGWNNAKNLRSNFTFGSTSSSRLHTFCDTILFLEKKEKILTLQTLWHNHWKKSLSTHN